MIPFPIEKIHDEDSALDWWEQTFAASCESMGAQVSAAALVRNLVASLREIRGAALDVTLSLSEAASETGYSSKQVSRWVKSGKLLNAGTATMPRVRRGDIIAHKKTIPLPARPGIGIVATAQDVARSVANRQSRNGDG